MSTLNTRFTVGLAALLSVFVAGCSTRTQEKIRIACVGNSITYGSGTTNRVTDSYPAQLAALLGNAYEVGNFGRNGATLLNRGELPYSKCEEYRKALDFHPDMVFIKLGTNDSKLVNRVYLDDFVADCLSLIRSFRELPNRPTVVLLLPVPVFSRDTVSITASVVETKIIPMIRQAADAENCAVVDLHSLMLDSEHLFPDKVHPSTAGAAVIARQVAEFVVQRQSAEFVVQRHGTSRKSTDTERNSIK
jgi:lysophospholipase L1-like esterase